MLLNEIRDQLRLSLEGTAEWRSRKSTEYPDDTRNAEAAKLCEALAGSVGDIDDALVVAYGEVFEDVDDSKAHQVMLADVGFHSWPQSAAELVRDYIDKRQSEKERLAT